MGYADSVNLTALTEGFLDEVNKQLNLKYASAAARTADAALTAALREGIFSYLDDTNGLYVYSGSAWVEAILPVHGVWATYTPVWTANGGTAPSLGNGTLDGHYQKIGRTTHFAIRLIGGTTTTWGSGASRWRFTVPVAAGAGTWEQIVSDVAYVDLSVSAAPQSADVAGTDMAYIQTSAAFVETNLHSTVIVWANGDKVLINGTYQAGS